MTVVTITVDVRPSPIPADAEGVYEYGWKPHWSDERAWRKRVADSYGQWHWHDTWGHLAGPMKEHGECDCHLHHHQVCDVCQGPASPDKEEDSEAAPTTTQEDKAPWALVTGHCDCRLCREAIDVLRRHAPRTIDKT